MGEKNQEALKLQFDKRLFRRPFIANISNKNINDFSHSANMMCKISHVGLYLMRAR